MSQVSFDNYTLSGDVAVIAICVVMVILLTTSYVSRTRSFRIFMSIVGQLVCAALINIGYHTLLVPHNPNLYPLIYAMRILYHALLLDVLFLFTLYTTVVSGLEHKKARAVAIISSVLLIGDVGADIILTLSGAGFKIAADGTVLNRTNLFLIGYILFIMVLVVLMNRVGNLLYKRVMYGFYGTMAVSLVIRFGQLALNQSSLTTMTFVFPVIAMMYIMHSNPYNVTLGSVDIHAMEDMIRYMYARKASFVYLSIQLPEYDSEGKELPTEVRAVVRRFTGDYFRNSVVFQIGNGHMILIAPKRANPDYERRIERLLESFGRQYERFHIPYKIVIGESMEEISRKNEYVSLIRSIQKSMPENTIRRAGQEDIDRFNRSEYILRELTDIYNKRDLDDPRVLAFCQPVYNLQTGRFDTAEALMRLKLDETGLVFPDQFISLAENHGFIHVLTEIILHKTCREIKRLTDERFQISRISVNVSVLELKDDAFCSDVNRIIGDNSVPGEKIAIELTESRSEADFMLMKEKIEELRGKGIQFYLDDFGTGYSNMERIMELPFDIIKFDRSLVIASGADRRSEKIVENLAHLFRDMEYSVLYEGVEDDGDEERCREMSASYLQGYKYSRPVPIERLREYLPKAG
ncbi:MAG: EAL domain-containing protein [Clostridia bacterium]|nr:EAL domain-containing protein [Clostridia bacterium]